MNVLLIMVPVALMLGLGGLASFMWCMRTDQYEDLEGASLRVLNDDDLPSGVGTQSQTDSPS